jgi:hypothetical protein
VELFRLSVYCSYRRFATPPKEEKIMNGSSLLGFIISLIVLFAVGTIFFLTIDRVARDAFLARIAKIVIGCLILIAFVLAIAGVLGFGGGGLAASPQSIVVFAVGVLVLVVVLYLVDLFLNWLGPNMGMAPNIVEAVRFIITVVALIALILIAGAALIGGGGLGRPFHVGSLQQHDRTPAGSVLGLSAVPSKSGAASFA